MPGLVRMILNIVIPMAGRGSRFQEAGYTLPKPLIEVHGKAMIELVVHNLRPKRPHRFIFLCLKEHLEGYRIDQKLKKLAPGCRIVTVASITQGAACTVLLAKDLIGSDQPLMLANSDQWVDFSIEDYLQTFDASSWDGAILTMTATNPKWSFVRLNERGEITEVVEKQAVSDEATVGVYNYRRGKDFVRGAEGMIRKNLRVNNEFYVAPAFNELLREGKRIGYVNIGSDTEGMYGLGTPQDLERFLGLPIARKAVSF